MSEIARALQKLSENSYLQTLFFRFSNVFMEIKFHNLYNFREKINILLNKSVILLYKFIFSLNISQIIISQTKIITILKIRYLSNICYIFNTSMHFLQITVILLCALHVCLK